MKVFFAVAVTTSWSPHSDSLRPAGVCSIFFIVQMRMTHTSSATCPPSAHFLLHISTALVLPSLTLPSPLRPLLSLIHTSRRETTHQSSSTAASTNCTSCPAGYFCDDPEAVPQPCEVGYYSGGGSAVCLACQPGYRCPEASVSATPAGSECPEGTYCNPARTLLDCPAGTYGESLKNAFHAIHLHFPAK